MPDTPILSHKRQSHSRTASPALGSQSPAPIGTPNTSRKVLSRRKALQEFYNIQKQEEEAIAQEEAKLKDKPESEPNFPSSKVDLDNPEELERFIRTSKIEEILKVRNSITSNLNSHDLAKKSIIYDNYYELIKLSQTLGDLSKPKPPTKNFSGLGLYEESNQSSDEDYIDSVIGELSKFISEETVRFHGKFEDVIQELKQDNLETNSNTSIVGIAEEVQEPKFGPEVNKEELSKEISGLLGGNYPDKSNTIEDIQNLLGSLDSHKDELLILQLNDLKNKIQRV